MLRKKMRTSLPSLAAIKCRILLIEDQHSIAQLTMKMLEAKWGCEVIHAKSYAAAATLLNNASERFFITISDLNLPDAPNGEVIQLLLDHQQSVVAMTGYFDQDLHDKLMHQGVIDYVLKKNINAYEYITNLVGRFYKNQHTHVMVIDDSESVRNLTGAYLERQFLNVFYAENGQDGLELLHQHPEIKLVLVDSEMPVMDGLTFTATARQQHTTSSLCIIGISSSDNKHLSAQFLKHGANDFISKPFSYDEIACRVNQNLNMLDDIEEIHFIAHHDFLTLLPNRRYFFMHGESMIQTEEHDLVLVGIIDVDFFKKINDSYGHDAGDAVLKQVAALMQTHFKGHLVARLGGEEFGVILREHNTAATQRLEEFRQIIERTTFEVDTKQLTVTVSVGATTIQHTNLDMALQAADTQLYEAKRSGRNRVIIETQLVSISA